MLDVAGGAVGFALGHVAIGARRSWRDSIRRVERIVAARAGEFAFGVSLHPWRNLHALIVQSMKLIAAPLVVSIGRLPRRPKLT